MKTLMFLLMFSPFLAMVSPNVSLSNISKAIERGDAKALSEYFDDNVDIAIFDEEDTYDKSNAERVVNTFFTANKPNAYNQVHSGASKKENSKYAIGNLKTGNGTFRVYLYMKIDGSRYIIQELRIDED